MSKSEIVSFYKDKNVLITGGTGFMGKIVLEQILRKCDPKKVYLLIRAKKGTDPLKRLEDLVKVPLFDRLRKEKPHFQEKIVVIDGDTSQPDLGLSQSSISLLVEKINVVLHGAATVKFDEHIKLATEINVLGTKNMALLCHKMKNLNAFVHISTAFSNCPRKEIKEEFYEPGISCDNLIKVTESLKESQLTYITKELLGKWPNTYSFTKAVAEDAIRTYAQGLPVCVFRPAIITSTRSEPVGGWIDNLYGPTGVTVGVGAGVLRVFPCEGSSVAEIVPADMTAHALIAASYKTSLMGPTSDITIYNYVSSPQNPITWGNFMNETLIEGIKIPPTQTVWYFSVSIVKTRIMFFILSFLLHTLPALLIDLVLIATNKTPKALKIYTKIHKFSDVLRYFSIRTWKFGSSNTQALWSGLNKEDQELFDFDMAKLNWKAYVKVLVDGVRLYLFKESWDTLPAAKRRMFWFYILHRLTQVVFFGTVGYLMWSASRFII